MLILSFQRSRSKNLQNAIRLAGQFGTFQYGGQNLSITLMLKDVFERWQQFNDLFWMVVHWQGTWIEYDGMRYYSHHDMTTIFYSLQQAHNNWICVTQYKLVNLYRVYDAGEHLEDIAKEYLTDEQINRIIDVYNLKKKSHDPA